MAHVGQEIALGPAGGFGRFFGLLQFEGRLAPAADVVNKRGEQPIVFQPDRRNGQFDREFAPVAIQGRDLDAAVEHRPLLVVQKRRPVRGDGPRGIAAAQ